MRVAGVDAIRANFPALDRLEAHRPVAYFDGPGGTQVPQVVVDAMADYLLHHNANTHWHYPTSQETDEAIWRARQAVADFLNASPAEVVFGANMTSLTLHLGRGLGRAWGPGDEIVVTELDHHANVDPWRALERERGVTIRRVAMRTADGTLDWDDLARSLTPRTRLLAIGAASNALGTITDVRAAARLAHERGALVFVDAVHYAPHVLVDVQDLDCDFLACSAYKFYGPHVGILYGRAPWLATVDVPKLEPASGTPPERLETGTQNHEGIVGTAAAVNFLASLGGWRDGAAGGARRAALARVFDVLHARGRALVGRLWDGLRELPGVTVYGPAPDRPRTPTVAFAVRTLRAERVAAALAGDGLYVSDGDFYASTVIDRLGLAEEGVVRVGCACYTTDAEIERLLEALRRLTA